MLPASRLCQQPYYQSIMNLDVSCDAERTASLTEYKLKTFTSTHAYYAVFFRMPICDRES